MSRSGLPAGNRRGKITAVDRIDPTPESWRLSTADGIGCHLPTCYRQDNRGSDDWQGYT
jgi:hypothetical protein